MEAFLSILLTIAIVIYLTYLIGKLLLRRYINKKRREFEERFGGESGQGGFYRRYTWGSANRAKNDTDHKEGDIKVVDMGTNEKQVRNQVGDYVEYEEVEVTEEEITYEKKREE